MGDVFTNLVAIQPSAAVQLENDVERDQLAQPKSTGTMKQGMYAKRRKHGASRSTKPSGG